MRTSKVFAPALLLTLSVMACAATRVPPRARSFAEFLAARQDLVVEGLVLEATEVNHQPVESCGTQGLMPLPLTEIRLRVERVLSGIAESPELTILADGHGLFPSDSAVNTRIIAWGNRSCDDNWRLYCRVAVVGPDNRIHSPDDSPLMRPAEGNPIESVSLEELTGPASKFGTQPSNLFEDALAVALARRVDHNTWTSTGAVFQLDSLGWVVGTGMRVPRYLSFPRLHGCYPDIYPGDSLLVPIPGSPSSDTLLVDKCPSALRVKSGFAPGLGVRIDEAGLQRVLVRTGSTLRVRRVLQEAR